MWYISLFEKAVARRTRVAAKITTAQGNTYYGVNVESSCPTLSICAERVAIFNAILVEGPDMKICSLDVIALKNGKLINIIPCGACRQLTAEYSTELTTLADKKIAEWLPNPYI